MTQRTLESLRVLVTRPLLQAGELKTALEAAGSNVILLPTIEISANEALNIDRLAQRIETARIAIFTSVNAVKFTQSLLASHYLQLPQSTQIAAIGETTAQALRQAGYKVTIKPSDCFTSEALLNLPQLQHLSGQQVLIFKGVGGRDLLAQTLCQRGAVIQEVNVYQRHVPANLQFAWQCNPVDIIIITSAEALENLYNSLDYAGQQWLKMTPIVVASERIADIAKKLLVDTVYTAEGASTVALLKCLSEISLKLTGKQQGV